MIARFQKSRSQKMSGMTLLEILLYVSISGLVIFAASGMLSIIYEVKQKGRTITAVEQEGTLMAYTIERYIQSANLVFTPDHYRESDRLGLGVIINNRESNVFLSLNSGILYSEINNAEKVALTSSDIIISDLVFKYFGASEKGFIRYSFKVSGNDLSGKNEYSKIFTGGASLR